MLIDSYGRPVTSMRISITTSCNLRCVYCHREGVSSAARELTPEEIARVVEAAVDLGIAKFKITGGEPLVRSDIVDVVEAISSQRGVKEVSMTTNGTLLAEYAQDLARAGLRRVNVSLDSLDPETYKLITRSTYPLQKVVEGIDAAIEHGLSPLKVNFVVMAGLNYEEIPHMLEFARSRGAVLQLIELEPVGVSRDFFEKHFVPLDEVEKALAQRAEKIVTRALHRRRVYYLRNGGVVELVRPFHNTEFCMNCRRIRLTPDGRLKPCLMREDNCVDLYPALSEGSLSSVKKAIVEAVKRRRPFYQLRRSEVG